MLDFVNKLIKQLLEALLGRQVTEAEIIAAAIIAVATIVGTVCTAMVAILKHRQIQALVRLLTQKEARLNAASAENNEQRVRLAVAEQLVAQREQDLRARQQEVETWNRKITELRAK